LKLEQESNGQQLNKSRGNILEDVGITVFAVRPCTPVESKRYFPLTDTGQTRIIPDKVHGGSIYYNSDSFFGYLLAGDQIVNMIDGVS